MNRHLRAWATALVFASLLTWYGYRVYDNTGDHASLKAMRAAEAQQRATQAVAVTAKLRERWPLERLSGAQALSLEFLEAREREACVRSVNRAALRVREGGSLPASEKEEILRELVEELNAFDERFDCIETEAREQLCEVVDALASHLGLPLQETSWADQWRDW